MKVAIIFEDVIMPNGTDGVAIALQPLADITEEEAALPPTKAMWITSTIVDMFNSGEIQQHTLNFINRNNGITGVTPVPDSGSSA